MPRKEPAPAPWIMGWVEELPVFVFGTDEGLPRAPVGVRGYLGEGRAVAVGLPRLVGVFVSGLLEELHQRRRPPIQRQWTNLFFLFHPFVRFHFVHCVLKTHMASATCNEKNTSTRHDSSTSGELKKFTTQNDEIWRKKKEAGHVSCKSGDEKFTRKRREEAWCF